MKTDSSARAKRASHTVPRSSDPPSGGLADTAPVTVSKAAASSARRIASRVSLLCALTAIALLPSVAGAGADLSPKAPSELMLTRAAATELSLSWRQSGPRGGSTVAAYGLYVGDARVGSTTATQYSFTGLDCATAYTLGVDAVDDAGRRSSLVTVTASTAPCAEDTTAPSPNLSSSTASSTAASQSFRPDADARVREAYPSTNYGSSTSLRVDGGSDPDVNTYVRFAVSNLSGVVTSAKLRLYTTSPTADGPAVYATATDWAEGGITWSNRPARIGSPSDDKGAISTGTWAEFDVTRLLAGNGAYAFVLVGSSSDGVDFSSRQGTASPELVVSTGTAPGNPSPPTAPRSLAATGVTASTVALTWLPSTDDVGVAGYDVYVDGAKKGTTSLTTYTVSSLACGKTYTFGVEAFDGARNVGPRVAVSAATAACPTTPPPPPTPFVCAKTLAAGADLSTFVSSLRAGDVGCLRGGTYTDGTTVTWSVDGTASSRITLTEYPGEQAEIVGTKLVVAGDYLTVRDLTMRDVQTLDYDGLAVSGTGDRAEHNVIKRTARHGILLHTSARAVTVTRNFIADVGLNSANSYPDHGIYVQGSGGSVTSNVFSRMKGYGIHVYGSGVSDYVVAQNTVVGSLEKGGILVDTAGGNIRVVNNISAQNASYGIINRRCDGGGCAVDRNLVYGNRSGGVSGSASSTISADPSFVDAASGDFRLQGASPAIEVGRSDYSYLDLDGQPRLSLPDLGAFESSTSR